MGGSRPALVATGVAEVLDTCWRCLAASHPPEATNATSTKAQLRREEDMIADCCKRTKSGG